jgi:hypothetical protein
MEGEFAPRGRAGLGLIPTPVSYSGEKQVGRRRARVATAPVCPYAPPSSTAYAYESDNHTRIEVANVAPLFFSAEYYSDQVA